MEPVGFFSANPRLTWEFEETVAEASKGQEQTAYRIWIADTYAEITQETTPTLRGSTGTSMGHYWVDSSDTYHEISVAGLNLNRGKRYWWKVAVKDQFGNVSSWSEPTHFTNGVNTWDTETKWIAVDSDQDESNKLNTRAGFLSTVVDEIDPDSPPTLVIDLGEGVLDENGEVHIDEIRLLPAWNPNAYDDFSIPGKGVGYLFPLELSIETNVTAEGEKNKKSKPNKELKGRTETGVADSTPESKTELTPRSRGNFAVFNNPLIFEIDQTSNRYLFFKFYTLFSEHPDALDKSGFALAELEIMSNGVNIARNAVLAPNSIRGVASSDHWDEAFLNDGIQRSGASPAVYLRRQVDHSSVTDTEFFSDDENRAIAFVSSLGSHELRVNGTPINNEDADAGRTIGKNHIGQVWTRYDVRAGYQTHDITDLVRSGTSTPTTFSVVLGEGNFTGPVWSFGSFIYGDQPALKMEVWAIHKGHSATADACFLKTEVGDSESDPEDERWMATTKTNLFASGIGNGDNYVQDVDKYYGSINYSLDDWDANGYFDGGSDPDNLWEDVIVLTPAIGKSEPQAIERVQIVDEISMGETNLVLNEGTHQIYEATETVAGWVKLEVNIPSNSPDPETTREIRVRYAESLDPDAASPRLHTLNLGAAYQTDTYLVETGSTVVLEPLLATHGFKAFEVGGIRYGTDSVLAATVVVAHSSVTNVGRFICSNPNITKLHDNVERSFAVDQQGYMIGAPSVSENVGWMDYGNTLKSAAFVRDVAGFFSKAMQDIVDSTNEGRFCDFAPMNPDDIPQ
ncbi:MAG: alpha-L-rhamnosidase N-terminal domain-containing protein, partial [Candidatus Omnitrophica bacterium]|nr:alpha-L-rhamnosidase N-terminal domain-containing protein [Candidatus Omnitrophota bacterium]